MRDSLANFFSLSSSRLAPNVGTHDSLRVFLARPSQEGKVLNESKDREQQELRKRIQTNRKKKIEIREKGHVKSVKFGANPDQDEVEKRMVKTATKGVVRLFNAIYQAQRQLEKAGRNKEVANKAKTSLLQELEGAARNLGSKTEVGTHTTPRSHPHSRPSPSRPLTIGGTDALISSHLVSLIDRSQGEARNGGEREGGQGRGGAGWDVLSDGFTGLSGRTKLKDWDKEEEEELEMEMETIQESESEDESEDEEEI